MLISSFRLQRTDISINVDIQRRSHFCAEVGGSIGDVSVHMMSELRRIVCGFHRAAYKSGRSIISCLWPLQYQDGDISAVRGQALRIASGGIMWVDRRDFVTLAVGSVVAANATPRLVAIFRHGRWPSNA
jgi:hypothetical protein